LLQFRGAEPLSRNGWRTPKFHVKQLPVSAETGKLIGSKPTSGVSRCATPTPVAISNHRLLNLADGEVIFRWEDYAHDKQRKMTVLA